MTPETWNPPSWDVAQICREGHVANSTVHHCPEACDIRCEDCGKETLTKCPNQHAIRGMYINEDNQPDGDPTEYEPPLFCRECGCGYPWTHKKLRQLESNIGQLAKRNGLADEDISALKAALPGIANPEPEASHSAGQRIAIFLTRFTSSAAARKVYQICEKVGTQVAADAIKNGMGW